MTAANEHVCSFQGQPLVRPHCIISKWPFIAAVEHVSASHGKPFVRAHCSTSKCHCLQHQNTSLRPRTSISSNRLNHLHVPFSATTGVPRTTNTPSPLQYPQITVACSITRICVPRTTICLSPLEHLRLPVLCSKEQVSRTTLGTSPL